MNAKALLYQRSTSFPEGAQASPSLTLKSVDAFASDPVPTGSHHPKLLDENEIMTRPRTAIIIGAGPAGLTAAYELLTRSDIRPVVIEMSDQLGGISTTVNYRGNRIDMGGHRFFSKSDRVMNWWFQHLPLQELAPDSPLRISYQGGSRDVAVSHGADPSKAERVMLVRQRKSRIFFLRKFFDYPISLTARTIKNLGLIRTATIGLSYMRRALLPLKEERNLEQFFINRFGAELYNTFFKSYTEKVWGVPCTQIDAEWGAQRIKELSVWKTIKHFIKKRLWRGSAEVPQKNTETSLIERFLYPKYGPGQMWEEVARKVQDMGGTIVMEQAVREVRTCKNRIVGVTTLDRHGSSYAYDGEFFFSTMPIRDFIRSLNTAVPGNVQEVSDGLMYRDFITVGLLLEDLNVREQTEQGQKLISDNWIYIQEPDVLAGRLQIFNNWSPWMVSDPAKVWIGVEYFCKEGDSLWTRSDGQMKDLAVEEMVRIGIIRQSALLDSVVLRMPKAYPAYFGTYKRFTEIRQFIDGFENLFLIGRNGMHRYNNQDHSMLTAMTAVDNIIAGRKDKANIWDVNTEMDYHEVSSTPEEVVVS
jgi:protoporphyrinogen oxidase